MKRILITMILGLVAMTTFAQWKQTVYTVPNNASPFIVTLNQGQLVHDSTTHQIWQLGQRATGALTLATTSQKNLVGGITPDSTWISGRFDTLRITDTLISTGGASFATDVVAGNRLRLYDSDISDYADIFSFGEILNISGAGSNQGIKANAYLFHNNNKFISSSSQPYLAIFSDTVLISGVGNTALKLLRYGYDSLVFASTADTAYIKSNNPIKIESDLVVEGELDLGNKQTLPAALKEVGSGTNLGSSANDVDTVYSRFYSTIPINTGAVTAGTGITAAMLGSIIYYNDAGNIDISSDPQIIDGTDGMRISFIGTHATGTLKFDDGTGLQLSGGTSFTMGSGDFISFIYVLSLDLWIETGRSDN